MAQPDLLEPQRAAFPPIESFRGTRPRLSARLWNLDWRSVLPWHFDDARVEWSTPEEVLPFMREHYPAIFGQADAQARWLSTPMTEAKRRFFAEMDFFAFRVGPHLAGVFMGHPSDWSSYYLRSTAILPEYRERRLMTRFLERFDEPLRAAGVERVEADVSPANAPAIRILLDHGYVVTGQAGSERWGLLLRYTKFLRDEAREAFVRQYTAMPIARRREPSPDRPQGRQAHTETETPQHRQE